MRSNPLYYISPSDVSITPNAYHNDADFLSVYIQRGAKIKVYVKDCPGLDYDNNNYRQWTLQGRNRRLNGGDGPYTIYARLNPESTSNAYLVFAPMQAIPGGWQDKYTPVNELTRQPTDGYWWVKLGTVSQIINGQRTIELDTGILGTQEYNDAWQLQPDNLPFSVVIDNSREANPPYVKWDTSIELQARLIQGWDTDASSRVAYWIIERSTDDASADAAWNNSHRTAVAADGTITLYHNKSGQNPVDDFNKAVAAAFTLKAYGFPDSGSSDDGSSSDDSSDPGEPVVLATGSITILPETVARYRMELSAAAIHYNPSDNTYTPSAGITIGIISIAEDGTSSQLTQQQIQDARLNLYYDQIDVAHRLTFSSGSANLPVSVFQTLQRSVILFLTENSTEAARETVSFLSDGKDGTGIDIKGTADVLYNADKTSPSQTSLQELTGVAPGDCWVVDANRHLYSYKGTSESFPNNWRDLGEFKGEKGDQGQPGPSGESVWIADCDNQMDSISTNNVGMVRTEQDVETTLSLYYGKTAMPFNVVSVQRNDETPVTVSGGGAGFVNFNWQIQGKPNVLRIRYGGGASFGDPVREKDIFTVIIRSEDEPTIERTLTVKVVWTEGVVYNLNPSVSQANVGRTDSGGYTPDNYNLTCGYTRKNEDGTVSSNTDWTGPIDNTWRIYFRRHHRPTTAQPNGYWESIYHRYGNPSYKIYVTSLAVATWDAVEFILCSSSGDELDSVSGVIDRETVPVVADGAKGEQGEEGEKGDPGTNGTSPYIAALNTDVVMLHTTGNGRPTKTQTISIVPSLRKGEEDIAPSITAVKRNGTPMSRSGSAWVATGLRISYNSTTRIITIAYETNAQIQNGADVFAFTIAHVSGGSTLFSDEKILTVNAYSQDQYTLLPSADQIVVDRIGGTYSPDKFTLKCGYRKIDIDGQVVRVDTVLERIDGLYNLYFRRHLRQARVWENIYYLYSYFAEGQEDSSSSGDDSDTGEHMLTDVPVDQYDAVEFVLCSNTQHTFNVAAVTGLLFQASVPVLTNGTAGATGPSYYYQGEWLYQGELPDNPNPEYLPDGTEIKTTQYERPFISCTIGEEALYYLYIGPGTVVTDSNRYDPQQRPDLWEPMQSQNKYIIANAIFADFAKFGSAVMNKDWLISSNGRIDGVEFVGGNRISGKKVDATGSGWSEQAYTLFNPVNPKATSQSVLYGKNQGLDTVTHNREIGKVVLSASDTYSVRLWGQAGNGAANIYIKASRSGIGDVNVLKFDDFVTAEHSMQAFFRVAEDGEYVIDITETGPPWYGAIVSFIEISKVAFAPIYALDLFTGASIQRDIMTSGFIRKDKSVINRLNLEDYILAFGDNRINLDACGSFVEVKDSLSLRLWLPVLCRYYEESGVFAFVQEEKDSIRAIVGTRLLFYLTDGTLDSEQISYGWWKVRNEYTVIRHLLIDGNPITDPPSGSASYDVSNTFLYRVEIIRVSEDNDGKPIYEYNWYFHTLVSGQFAELECMIDTDNQGYEIVWWRINKIGLIS